MGADALDDFLHSADAEDGRVIALRWDEDFIGGQETGYCEDIQAGGRVNHYIVEPKWGSAQGFSQSP